MTRRRYRGGLERGLTEKYNGGEKGGGGRNLSIGQRGVKGNSIEKQKPGGHLRVKSGNLHPAAHRRRIDTVAKG